MKINFIEALTTYGRMEQDNDSINTPNTRVSDYFSSDTSSFTPTPSAANISSSNQAIQQLLQGFKELKTKVDTLSSNETGRGYDSGRNSSGRGNGNRGNNNTIPTINPRTGQAYKRYC